MRYFYGFMLRWTSLPRRLERLRFQCRSKRWQSPIIGPALIQGSTQTGMPEVGAYFAALWAGVSAFLVVAYFRSNADEEQFFR